MAWFRKTKKPKPIRMDRPRSNVPEGLWVKCEGCKEIVYSRDLDRNLKVCPKCGYHFRIDARARVSLLLDEPSRGSCSPASRRWTRSTSVTPSATATA